jgi:group I intron endonuclease
MEGDIMSYIYKIINDINDKVYIGKTAFNIEKRFKEHCDDAFRDRNEKRPLYAAMRKYGIDHFYIEQIEECSDEASSDREAYWIGIYSAYEKGYNATLGGDGKFLYDHTAIALRLQEHPYSQEVADEFGCCVDIVREIANQYNISLLSHNTHNKKCIIAYTKGGEMVQSFESTIAAAQWCYDNQKCATLNSGVRSHIAECANGKRKTAYGYVWKY